MTAHGELYVTETIRDEFRYELDKAFGEGKWILDGSEWSDVWNTGSLSDRMTIPVRDEDMDNIIGEITVKNKFEIVQVISGRYIECYPDEILEIKKIEYKGEDLGG